MLDRVRQRARQLKREVYALYLAVRDPRTPWYARLFAGMVVAYACSPLDLIPDFIPVLGYLDDVLLVPLGIWLALKMIPTAVLADSRLVADEMLAAGKPVNRGAAVVIVAVWLLLALLVAIMIARFVRGGDDGEPVSRRSRSGGKGQRGMVSSGVSPTPTPTFLKYTAEQVVAKLQPLGVSNIVVGSLDS